MDELKTRSQISDLRKDKVVFFGNERLATAATTTAPTLKALVDAGYKIEAVIANHKDPVSHQGRDLEIGEIAQSYGIPVILPGSEIPLKEKVSKHPSDVAVLVAFGKIIPQAVIDMFPKGIINIHPSLLPNLRGTTPIETAILDGLKETGVSIMKISAEMDAGPVYAQAKLSLTGTETKAELAAKLNNLGAELLIKHLPNILNGSLVPIDQDHMAATYTKMIKKEDGRLDWNKSAARLEREVRAYAEWPKSNTTIAGKDVIVTKAHVGQISDLRSQKKQSEVFKSEDGMLAVQTADGLLIIDNLKPAGKKEMTAAEFIRGYGQNL